MVDEVKTVNDYLRELRQTRKGKPEQVQDALDIYVELWENVVERGTVGLDDSIEVALSKIDKAGGLYKASEGQ